MLKERKMLGNLGTLEAILLERLDAHIHRPYRNRSQHQVPKMLENVDMMDSWKKKGSDW